MTESERHPPRAPLLSVVVTLVDGGSVMRRFLDAMRGQVDPPRLEILLPYDESVRAATEALRDDYPDVTLLDLGTIDTERPISTAAGQHELYDRRRAAGLAAATGDIIAILEDRGAPRPDWAAAIMRTHAANDYGVVGGAIDSVATGTLDWAFYVCDFGRYARPFASGPVEWISDVNVSYKRRALEDTRDLWQERFQEPIVHWALRDSGEVLYLSEDCVVEHLRPPTSPATLIRERFHWGRLFGHIRAGQLAWPRRALLTLLGPLIAPLLFVRHGIGQARKGNAGRFIRAAPSIALLVTAWTTGEVWGYITGRS